MASAFSGIQETKNGRGSVSFDLARHKGLKNKRLTQ
jgi:hypothetical protein